MYKNLVNLIGILLFISNAYSQELNYSYSPTPWRIAKEKLLESSEEFTDHELSEVKNQFEEKKVRRIVLEAISDRQSSLESMIESGELILEGELYNYVSGVLDKLVAESGGNATLAIVRNESPNAFNSGNNLVFIHLGLLIRLNSEEELAFVLAHELAHNFEKHFLKSVGNYALMQTNDSISRRIQEIKSSKYGRVSATNELLIPWILSSREDSRMKEYDADELAFEWCHSAGYHVADAIQVFDVLGFGEHERDTVVYDLNSLLALDHLTYDFTKALNPQFESSLGAFIVEKDSLQDLLRTHPFSKERKAIYLEKAGSPSHELFELVDAYAPYRYMAEVELLATLMHEDRIDRAILYALSMYRENSDHAMAKNILPLSFMYLANAKEHRYLGTLVNSNDNNFDDVYNSLIYFLRRISPEACKEICFNLLSKFEVKESSKDMNPIKAIECLEENMEDDYVIRFAVEEQNPSRFYVVKILNTIANK